MLSLKILKKPMFPLKILNSNKKDIFMTKTLEDIRSKGIYIVNIIEELEQISRYDFQKAAWIEGNQGLCFSYYDLYSGLYLDTGLEMSWKAGETVFGKDIDKQFKDLIREMEKISFFDLEQYIIDSPQMEIVRKKALALLPLIENAKSDQGDNYFLLSIEIPVLNSNKTRPAFSEARPDGTYHILEIGPWVKLGEELAFQVGDIVQCTKTITPDIWRQRVFIATEKVGFEAVV